MNKPVKLRTYTTDRRFQAKKVTKEKQGFTGKNFVNFFKDCILTNYY